MRLSLRRRKKNKQDDIGEVVQKAIADFADKKEQEAIGIKEKEERRQLWNSLPNKTKLALMRRKAGRDGKTI